MRTKIRSGSFDRDVQCGERTTCDAKDKVCKVTVYKPRLKEKS